MRQSVLIAAALAAVANLFWAANAIVGKAAIASLPAFTLSQFRWSLAFVFLAPFGIPRILRQRLWYRQNLLALIALSVLSVTFYNTLQYWSLEYTEPVKVGAMLALMPLSISIVSSVFGGRRQTLMEWVMSAVAVTGAMTVVTDGHPLQVFSGQSAGVGEVLMVLAITSWALYSVLLKKMPHQAVDMIGLLTFFVGIGTLLILPFWVFDIVTEPVFVPSGTLWWSVLFVAVFPSIVSFMCWNAAVKIGDATIAGLMVTSAPLFNALLSIIFLHASISLAQWIGIAVVIVGVAGALLISRRTAAVSP
ncbi:DMT family transporter [Reinekea sp. G2M2-21]|uniref:DMT family transporter n=1 Tax=Reinekea sp. G2M2-21 TaxID=2788942 RepID=UPI0018A90931|nr:DMT family transporter [Reinekea sp. G2M2-21]